MKVLKIIIQSIGLILELIYLFLVSLLGNLPKVCLMYAGCWLWDLFTIDTRDEKPITDEMLLAQEDLLLILDSGAFAE